MEGPSNRLVERGKRPTFSKSDFSANISVTFSDEQIYDELFRWSWGLKVHEGTVSRCLHDIEFGDYPFIALLDALAELSIGRNLIEVGKIELKELDSFLRDMNHVSAFPKNFPRSNLWEQVKKSLLEGLWDEHFFSNIKEDEGERYIWRGVSYTERIILLGKIFDKISVDNKFLGLKLQLIALEGNMVFIEISEGIEIDICLRILNKAVDRLFEKNCSLKFVAE